MDVARIVFSPISLSDIDFETDSSGSDSSSSIETNSGTLDSVIIISVRCCVVPGTVYQDLDETIPPDFTHLDARNVEILDLLLLSTKKRWEDGR